MNTLIKWLVTAVAVIVTAYLLPGVSVAGFGSALIVAVVLALVTIFIKPVLLILTLPINILTLGLFTFVINAILILLVDFVVPGFAVDNFLWALVFSLILALVNGVLQRLVRD